MFATAKKSSDRAASNLHVPTTDSAIKIALCYAAAGALWILCSGWVLHQLALDHEVQAGVEMVKGWFFIVSTALLLGLALNRYFKTLRHSAELLQASEERWKHALEGAAQAAWDWNPQSNEVFYSTEWKAMLGYEPHEIGNTLAEWETRVHPDDLPRVKETLRQHLDGQDSSYATEHRMRCKDGSYKWILDQGKVTSRSPDGKPLRMVGTHADIHQRKQAEQLNRIEHDLMQSLAATGRLEEGLGLCLDAAVQADGLSCVGIYLLNPGRNALELVAHKGLSPDFVRAAACFEASSPQMKLVTANKPVYAEFDDLKLNPSAVELREDLHSIAIIPIVNEGQLLGSLNAASHKHAEIPHPARLALETIAAGAGQAIARLRAQEALHASENNFRTFFQTIDDLIIVATPEGRILFGNAAVERKLGFNAQELTGMTVAELHPVEVRPEAETILAAMFRGEREVCPLPLACKDGKLLPVETRAWFGLWNGQSCLFGLSKDLSLEQEAQQRFERLFRHNPLPMALSELPDQRFADVNDAWLETMGYERAEVVGKTARELNLFQDPQAHARAATLLKETGEVREVELLVRTKDGAIRDGLFTGEIVRSQGKNHFLTVMVDVTERKKIEAALRERLELQDQLAKVATTVPGLICSFKLRPDGSTCMPFATQAIKDLYGLQPSDVREDFSPVLDRIHPDDQEKLQQGIAASARTMEPWRDVFRARHPEKGEIWVEGHSVPRREPDGSILWHGFVQDVTERKQAEATLRESLLFRREAEKIARIGAWKVSPESDYLYWTEGVYEILEAPVDYKPGLQEGLQLYDAESIPTIQAALEAALKDGTPFTIEAGVTTTKGRHLWAEICGLGRLEEGGQAYVMGTFQDITERKKRESYNQLRLRTLQLLAADVPLREVLESIVTLLECGRENWRGSVMLVAESESRLYCGAAPRLPQFYLEAINGVPITVGSGSCGTAAATKQQVIVEDIATHPHWTNYREIAARAGLRACWSMPIRSAQGGILGALAVYRDKPGGPTPEELRDIESVLDLAGVAISKLKAEEALREREEIFSSIVGQAADAIAVVNGANGRFVEFNAAAYEGLGYTREEFARLSLNDIQEGDSVELIRQNMITVRTSGATRFESKHRHRNGNLLDVRVNIQRLHIRNHDYMAVVWTDITDRKRAKARAARDKLRTDFLLDLHQRAAQLTDKELYDHVLEQAVQLTDSTIGFFHQVSEDQNTILLTTWNQEALKQCTATYNTHYPLKEAGNWVDCVREQRAVIYNDFAHSPNQHGLPAGHAPVRRFMSIPVLQNGLARIIFGVGNKLEDYDQEDLTQLQLVANELHKLMTQRAAQKQLRESEERFRQLVETTCDWIWEVDAAARYTYASPKARELLDCAPEEVLGKTLFDFMPETDAQRVKGQLSGIMSRREPFSAIERIIRHKNGREVVLESSGVPVLGTDGQLLGYRGMDRDISERKQLQQQLLQAQKLEAVGQLAGGVAHDFNNILAAIMMHLGLLRSNRTLDEETRQALRDLDTEAHRAATLTRQLLMFSRRSVMAVKELDINEVVANLLKMLGRLIGEQIELQFQPKTGLPAVNADAGMLEQVVMNLVVNARDAMPKGGRITITTAQIQFSATEVAAHPDRQIGRFVCLAVSDTGCGMDSITLTRIFEPFFTTKEVGKGTGLGLATIHGITAQHHGWIEVESAVDQGSTFRVYLPALTVSQTAKAPSAEMTAMRGGKEIILVVEDDDKVRRMLVLSLGRLGYGVHEATNGQEAVMLWQSLGGRIDLLLTDMVMPEGMTGLELAEHLRATKPDLRVIVSSGYSAEIVQAGIPDIAGIHYLPKPYTTKTLADLVRKSLDHAPR